MLCNNCVSNKCIDVFFFFSFSHSHHCVCSTFTTEWTSLTTRLTKERHDIEDVQRRSAAATQARNWEVEIGKGGSILKAVQLHQLKQQTLKTRAQSVQWEAAQQRMSYRQAQAQLDEYRESLALLNKRLNVKTADDLLVRFETMENYNFSTLQHINELISQTAVLELKKQKLTEALHVVDCESKEHHMQEKKVQEALDHQEQNIQQYLARVFVCLESVTTIVRGFFLCRLSPF